MFTASNGYKVDPVGRYHQDELTALREYFRDERDRELGRWRWPERPNFTVTPERAIGGKLLNVRVLDESLPRAYSLTVERLTSEAFLQSTIHTSDPRHRLAALAYLAAEWPELLSGAKPWNAAKAGEFWALTVDGFEEAFRVREDGCFIQCDLGNTGPLFADPSKITAGRRIWPEAE